ncbi:MAG: hypothetical protein ACREF8_04795, partial [Chthoniobacterales bacterium]
FVTCSRISLSISPAFSQPVPIVRRSLFPAFRDRRLTTPSDEVYERQDSPTGNATAGVALTQA